MVQKFLFVLIGFVVFGGIGNLAQADDSRSRGGPRDFNRGGFNWMDFAAFDWEGWRRSGGDWRNAPFSKFIDGRSGGLSFGRGGSNFGRSSSSWSGWDLGSSSFGRGGSPWSSYGRGGVARGASDSGRQGWSGWSGGDRGSRRSYGSRSDSRDRDRAPWAQWSSRDGRGFMDRRDGGRSSDLERKLERLQSELEDLRRELRRR